jgi:hypothetical protein
MADLDLGMALEELGDALGILAVAVHAQRQGLDPAQDQEGILRRQHRAGHVLEAVEAHLQQRLLRADDGAGDQVAVAAEVLGRGMQHVVGAEFDRALQVGRAVGVVHHRQRAVAAGDGGNRRDVDQAHVGVGRRFEEHHLRLRADRRFEIARVGQVEVGDPDAELGQTMVEEAEGASVERLVGDDLVAGREQRPQQRGGRALPRAVTTAASPPSRSAMRCSSR